MQAAFQNSNKSSEISSVNSKNRSESISSNSQQIQVGINLQGDQNIMPTIIIQKRSFPMRNDSRNDFQKCSTASCSASKKSLQPPKQGEFQNEKEQIHSDKLIMKIKDEQVVNSQNFAKNKKSQKLSPQYEDVNQEKLRQSFYGKRFFVGKGNISIGQQGKQHIVAFLGLFIPISCFILYEVQFPQGLCSYDGLSWIVIVSIASILSLFLFIYCSISNPGFIAIPLTQKQRHSLPVVQQKGQKLFDLRYCYTCHIYRPLRTHHCKICDLCVIERDHHCPFLNNCIGHQNRRGYIYFLLVIVTMKLLIVTECLFQIIYPFVEDDDFVQTIQRISVILAIIQCIYSAILAANILSLLIFQFQLIAKNHTTDEFRRLIVPDPKPVDIELNKEFDYGCLSNFNHVLFYSRPSEIIYQNFDKLDKTYLIQRYNYYKKKDILLDQEEEEIKLNNQFIIQNTKANNASEKVQLNDNNNNNNNDINNIKNNFHFTSMQSKPCISPQKQDQNIQDQTKFFLSSSKESAQRSNQAHLNSLFQLNIQHSQSQRITDKEHSPSQIFKEQNIQFNNQNLEQQIFKLDEIENNQVSQVGKTNNLAHLPPPPLILDNLKLRKISKNYSNQDFKDDQQNNDSEENQQNQFNVQQINLNLRKNKSLFVVTKNNSSRSEYNNQNQENNSRNGTIQQSTNSYYQKQIQSSQEQKANNLLQNNQNYQEYDSNIIIYELKPNEDTQVQSTQKRSTFSSYASKSQSSKNIENNSQNILASESTTPASCLQNNNKNTLDQINKKWQPANMDKQEIQNINFNQLLICDDDDDTPSSQIQQKRPDQVGIQYQQNINSANSSKNFVGFKNMSSDILSIQSQFIGDNSPKQNTMNTNQKDNILFDKNNIYHQNYNKQNSSDQSSISQFYQESRQKQYSTTSANTVGFDRNSIAKSKTNSTNDEILRNIKGFYNDPQQEQSTDLPTTFHDQQNIQTYQERIPSKLVPHSAVNEIQNNDDDFNIAQSQNNYDKNSIRQKQRLLQKRNKKLFQNMQKSSQQPRANSNNNSFSLCDNFVDENINNIAH
ncbi:DHHC zinc finger protein, partial (macronuclear) [Tetrahymena thermophila SB210]